jgi:hypothetical protein
VGDYTGRGCARQRPGGPWARGLLRAHGVPNFSASVNGDQVRMGFQGGAAAANSTRSLIAQRICRPLLPNFLSGS